MKLKNESENACKIFSPKLATCSTFIKPLEKAKKSRFLRQPKKYSKNNNNNRCNHESFLKSCQILTLICMILFCLGNLYKISPVECLFLAESDIISLAPATSLFSGAENNATPIAIDRSDQVPSTISNSDVPSYDDKRETSRDSKASIDSRENENDESVWGIEDRIISGHKFAMTVNGKEYKLEPPTETSDLSESPSEPPSWKKKVSRLGQSISDIGSNNYPIHEYESGFDLPATGEMPMRQKIGQTSSQMDEREPGDSNWQLQLSGDIMKAPKSENNTGSHTIGATSDKHRQQARPMNSRLLYVKPSMVKTSHSDQSSKNSNIKASNKTKMSILEPERYSRYVKKTGEKFNGQARQTWNQPGGSSQWNRVNEHNRSSKLSSSSLMRFNTPLSAMTSQIGAQNPSKSSTTPVNPNPISKELKQEKSLPLTANVNVSALEKKPDDYRSSEMKRKFNKLGSDRQMSSSKVNRLISYASAGNISDESTLESAKSSSVNQKSVLLNPSGKTNATDKTDARIIARDLTQKLSAPLSKGSDPQMGPTSAQNLSASTLKSRSKSLNSIDSIHQGNSSQRLNNRTLDVGGSALFPVKSIVRSGPIQMPTINPFGSAIFSHQTGLDRNNFRPNPFASLLPVSQHSDTSSQYVRNLLLNQSPFGVQTAESGVQSSPPVGITRFDFSTTKPTTASSVTRYASGTAIQEPLIATANQMRISHLNPNTNLVTSESNSYSSSNIPDDSSSDSNDSHMGAHQSLNDEGRGNDPIDTSSYDPSYSNNNNNQMAGRNVQSSQYNSSQDQEQHSRSSMNFQDGLLSKPELKPREGNNGIYGLNPMRSSVDPFELEMANSIGISPSEYERDLADLDEEFNRHNFRRPMHSSDSFLTLPERYESRRFNRLHPVDYSSAEYLNTAGSILPRPYISSVPGSSARTPHWSSSSFSPYPNRAISDFWPTDGLSDFTSPNLATLFSSQSVPQVYRWSRPRFHAQRLATPAFHYGHSGSHQQLSGSASESLMQPSSYNLFPASYATALPTETVSIAISPLAAAAAAAAASAIATADKSRQAAAAAAAASGSWFAFPRLAGGSSVPSASSVSPSATPAAPGSAPVISTAILHRPAPFAALSSVPIYAIARPSAPAASPALSPSFLAPLYHTAGFPILAYRPATSSLLAPSSLLAGSSFGYPTLRVPLASPNMSQRPTSSASVVTPARAPPFGIRPYYSDLQYAETKPKSNSSSHSSESGRTPFGKASSLTAMAKNLTKKMFGSGSSLRPQHLSPPVSSIDGIFTGINAQIQPSPLFSSAGQLQGFTRQALKIK